MRILSFLLLILLSGLAPSAAQTLKTDVLIYGNGSGAVAAAIQAARSGVKTTLLYDKISWSGKKILANHPTLFHGIWAEFAKNYADSTQNEKPNAKFFLIEPEKGDRILKQMADTVKRLNLVQSTKISGLKAAGKGWEVRLANGKKIKCEVLLDASSGHQLLRLLQISPPAGGGVRPDSKSQLFRTSVAVLDSVSILPIKTFIPEKTERILALPEVESALASMHAGQAAGATAAYCAFFDTNTKNLNIRTIQSELLTYRSSLYPLSDLLPGDTSFVKMQHLAVSGIFNSGFVQKSDGIYFQTEESLSTSALRVPMKSFYSRSQIWFADHASEKLSIQEAINLLMYTATRGEELRREIERGWKSTFGFRSDYEPARAISRKEFAILLDTYLQPFNARVDLEGELLN